MTYAMLNLNEKSMASPVCDFLAKKKGLSLAEYFTYCLYKLKN